MLNQDDLVLHNVLLQRLFLIKFIHILIEKQTQVIETKGRVRSNIKKKDAAIPHVRQVVPGLTRPNKKNELQNDRNKKKV
jgi:hypothetical protein